jgi:hypothetical protein
LNINPNPEREAEMKINMKTERLLADGSELEPFNGTRHGWPSVEEGTDELYKRFGSDVIRLPNGYEEKEFSRSTGVKLRVTLSEVA